MKRVLIKLAPLLFIVLIWFIFASPYFLKGLVPFPSKFLVSFFPPWNAEYGMAIKNNAMPDVITQIMPWKKITIDSWKQGVIPLWNPYSFSGTAHAANYQSSVFLPLNILFFFLSFIDAWSLMVLLQPLLAGWFIYLFLRSLGKSKGASTLGSIAWMFCGFLVTWMAYGTLGYAALVLPLALYACRTYFNRGNTGNLILLSLSLAFSFFSGHFQISLYVVGTIIVYILFEAIKDKKKKRGLVLLFFVGLGLLIAVPQLLLTYQAYIQSVRSSSFIKAEIIPWQYLITLLAPDFYGNPVTRNDWFGHYAEWASYIGVLPLFLAFYAGLAFKDRKRWLFLFLVLVTLLLAYPTPLTLLLFALKLPVISTSSASRIMVITSFSLSILAAFGFDDLINDLKNQKRKKIIVFVISGIVIIGLIWFTLFFIKPLPVQYLAIAKRNTLLPSLILLTSGVMFIISLVVPKKWVLLLPFICIGIASFDSLRYAIKWMPFDPKEYIYPTTRALAFLKQTVGNNRVFGNIGGEAGLQFLLPLIEGYDAMYQARYGKFMNAVSTGIISEGDRSVVQFDKYGRYKDKALELLGVRYILHRKSDGTNVWAFPVWQYPTSEMSKIYEDEYYKVYEYTKAYPRAFLASAYAVETDEQKIIDTLFSSSFDTRNTVVLEAKPVIEPTEGSGNVVISSYNSNSVIITTTLDQPKLLFLSDAYDPGWQAKIDGKKTLVYRADYDFRAVAVPAGIHTIRFYYWPKQLTIGLWLSIAGICILISYCLYYWYEHRHL